MSSENGYPRDTNNTDGIVKAMFEGLTLQYEKERDGYILASNNREHASLSRGIATNWETSVVIGWSRGNCDALSLKLGPRL